ncbi:hypothetical protein [Luteimonas salinilitoris]|uniref:Uncharacterized protein n=1 Tax=Luteimonas salinilitoris TaxID=3237697 RepID=A0ABV4HS59_9GAMM
MMTNHISLCVIKKGPALLLAATNIIQFYSISMLGSVATDSDIRMTEKVEKVEAVFVRRIGPDAIYEFEVQDTRRTYRCGFCPFNFSRVNPGDKVTITAISGRITSIGLSDGEVLSKSSSRQAKRAWELRVFVLMATISVLFLYAKRIQKGS